MSLLASHRDLPPGPNGHKILGLIPELRNRDMTQLNKYTKEYGDIVRLRIGPRSVYFLNHPDFVRHVLQTHHQNFAKETRAWHMIRMFLGPSVMIIAREPWKKRRRLMQPLFNPPAVSQLVSMMNRVIGEMVQEFLEKAAKGEELEIHREMMRVTLRVIGETIMGEDVGKYTEGVAKALGTVLDFVAESYTNLFNAPMFIPTKRNRSVRKALAVLNEIVFHFITERRKSNRRPDDLLSRLIEATYEGGKGHLTDTEIRDEIMTMFLAGHETTASSLSWAWYLLAQHPEIEEKLYREATSTLTATQPTLEDIPKLKYTIQVFDEVLRLYPPIWAVSRSTIREDEIGGYRIPAKATVFFSPFILHRNPKYWEDPETFDPERFANGSKEKIRPYTYVPFIEGPRKCLGYHFAMAESPLILAAVARNFRLNLVPNQEIKLNFSTTLRPKNGIRMVLEKR